MNHQPHSSAALTRRLAGLAMAIWHRHIHLMNTHASYAALVAITTAAMLGEIAVADARRWLGELLPRLATAITQRKSV